MKNKWIRRKRNSWGYGVQSPGDFYFVQHVLREKSPYYGYTLLEEIGKAYDGLLPSYSEATNKLLFRLADYMRSEVIIEVGAGLSIFAMAVGHPTARCIAVTASQTHKEAMLPLCAAHPEVAIRNGDEIEVFRSLMHEFNTIGMLHVAHTGHYKEIVDIALPYVTDRTLIVIEGLCATKEKHDWWKSLQESPQTGITYDLGNIGLLFFDRSRHKETYWINLRKKT